MLLLSTNLEQEIREHGAKDYPHECCGAMLGAETSAGREVRALYPLVNRRDDSPHNRFSITPEDFRAAERAATQRGLDLLGWYSFTSGPSGAAERIRQGARLAVAQLRDRKRGSGRSAEPDVLAA
jgi:proteasome lid subunit RPN8/RPN11